MAKFIALTGAHVENAPKIYFNVDSIGSFGPLVNLANGEEKQAKWPLANSAVERGDVTTYVRETPEQIYAMINSP